MLSSGAQTVDADAVAAYAAATNDANPRYADGRAVPPLFTITLALEAHTAVHRAARFGLEGVTGSVHGQHDVSIHRPLRPGVVLGCAASTRSVRHVGRGVLVTQEIVFTDDAAAVAAVHLWSTLHLDGVVAAECGPRPPDHTFPDEARSRPLGTLVVPIDRDQGFRYAGVSGDRNGHAISDAAARAEGLPRKILQGMCTFGMAAGALVDRYADGDPDRVRRLAVRFARPAFPGVAMEVIAHDGGRTDEGRRVIVFEALQAGSTVLKHGRMELGA